MRYDKIPIQNIYYLLAYAWNYFRSGELVDVDQIRCPDAHNLLAMLLTNAVRKLATKGMDKGYIGFTEETPRIRGRVQILQSYRRLTKQSGRMICEFDELTADTLPNQIIKSTCTRLLQHAAQLTKQNLAAVHSASHLLHDIRQIPLTSRDFSRVQLHRNNRHYRLLLHVCQMLHENYLPEESSGVRKFRNVLENETVMHRVFESFVRHFATRHCPDAKVSAMAIAWNGHWSEEVAAYIPIMKTDVTIVRSTHKIILDCKYYRDALTSGKYGPKMHSSHLYQLVAYLQNKCRHPGWHDVIGKLLYPSVNHPVSAKFELLGHRVEVQSIDLNQEWERIHDDLLKIVS